MRPPDSAVDGLSWRAFGLGLDEGFELGLSFVLQAVPDLLEEASVASQQSAIIEPLGVDEQGTAGLVQHEEAGGHGGFLQADGPVGPGLVRARRWEGLLAGEIPAPGRGEQLDGSGEGGQKAWSSRSCCTSSHGTAYRWP